MKQTSTLPWKAFAFEALGLGIFMISASVFVALFEHPYFHLQSLIPNPIWRRMCIALAMGITAILIIYSKWGKYSGAHINPAVTLANVQLNRISWRDALGYIIAQLTGATLSMWLLKVIFPQTVADPSVNYVLTQPGAFGIGVALLAEFLLAFILFFTVLLVSNSKWATYTGYVAGLLVFLFISVEAPLSGMSINPARSFGPALVSGNWHAYWIYLVAPTAGMQLAAYAFRSWYFYRNGECKTMACFMSGNKSTNATYHVYSWFQKKENGDIVQMNNSSPRTTNHLRVIKSTT